MSTNESEHQLNLVEQEWLNDNQAIEAILQAGAESYIKSLPEINVSDLEHVCSCIDERVGGFKLALPGSGILNPDLAKQALRESGVKKITSHQDCGAAGLAFAQLSEEEKSRYGTANEFAIQWTKQLASELGIEYVGHVPVETPGLHTARAVYYDCSGDFVADRPGLPKGFTISRDQMDPKSAKSSLELSIKIAFGDHGFGSKFTKDNPLVIVPIGSQSDIRQLEQEISDVVANLPDVSEKIHIDSGLVQAEQTDVAA